MQIIRLACDHCERDDYDYLTSPDQLPVDWQALVQLSPDTHRRWKPWFTHLGVCPSCQPTREELQ